MIAANRVQITAICLNGVFLEPFTHVVEYLKSVCAINATGTAHMASAMKQGKSGRKADVLYIEAYKLIVEQGKSQVEAFAWWQNQQKHKANGDKERFDSAMRRLRKKATNSDGINS